MEIILVFVTPVEQGIPGVTIKGGQRYITGTEPLQYCV